jgi:hypothetical protein
MVETTLDALNKKLRRQYMSLITLLVSNLMPLGITLLISRNNIKLKDRFHLFFLGVSSTLLEDSKTHRETHPSQATISRLLRFNPITEM